MLYPTELLGRSISSWNCARCQQMRRDGFTRSIVILVDIIIISNSNKNSPIFAEEQDRDLKILMALRCTLCLCTEWMCQPCSWGELQLVYFHRAYSHEESVRHASNPSLAVL
jgi:hypothetical protein